MVFPFRNFPPIDRSNFHNGSFQQDNYDVGSNVFIGNPLTNQYIGGSVVLSSSHNGCRKLDDQNKWNQSFNNIMNMNHNASTNGSRGSWGGTDHMNKNNDKIVNNRVFMVSYRLEKHGL